MTGVRIVRMLLNDYRLKNEMPVRMLTDAHKTSTTEAVTSLLKERGAKMEFVLSGGTQFTQFMDIRGGAAQALKNGGENSIRAILSRFYDTTQKSKYKRYFSPNGTVLPMRITDCIDMVETALKEHVTQQVIKRSWDAVGTDLLPDLRSLMSLTSGLKRAFLHTPQEQNPEEIAKIWLERENDKKTLRDARKIE